MKKQTRSTIKAHLIRSAFYVLLLLAVCVIPFALAQSHSRGTSNRSITKARVAANRALLPSQGDLPASVTQSKAWQSSHAKAARAKNKAQMKSQAGATSRFSNAFGRAPKSSVSRKSPTGVVCSYGFTEGTDAIVPGDTDTGNHTDDGDTFVPIPFSFSLYDQTFNGVNVSSNGRADFMCVNEPGGFLSSCLPAPDNICAFDYTIFPVWSDYRTDIVGEGCANFATGCGVFTSVSGSAPNRIFNIEWRAVYFADHTQTANFELRLYENDPDKRFDIVIGDVQPGSDELYVSGVQGPAGTFTSDFCVDPPGPPPTNVSRSYTCGGGPTPTPTPPVKCGLLIGSGMTLGFEPNGWNPTLASNTVNYTFSNSQPAANEFALFETHDPWGFTTIKDAINGAGHTYTEFTPADLAGFDFSQYSVVILNWDDTFTGDFIGDYTAAIPALESYINAGGVVWVQSAIQGCDDPVPMPFGGQGDGCDFSSSDPVVDPASPMMVGMPNPIPGNSASHLSYTSLPGGAHVVVISGNNSNPTLYDFRPGENCGGGTPTPTPACSPAPWQEVAAMTTDLYGAAGGSDGANFYAAGGYSFSQGVTLNILQKYDGTGWTTLSPMPQSQIEGCGVYYPPTNTFYVFGGEDAVSGTNYNLTQIYDIASDSWSMGANMPDVRSFGACGYVPASGMIYVVAGYNTGDVTSSQNTTWQYDPVANSWTDLTSTDPYPHAAGGFGFGVINDKLYVAGGRDAALNIINDTYEFDPQAPAGSRYTQKADEPGTFQNNVPGSASAQNLLWVFGGGNPFVAGAAETKAGIAAPSSAHIVKTRSSFPLELVKRLFGRKPAVPDTDGSGRFYDPGTDTWTASPNMNEARAFSTGGAITNSLIIAAGGYNGVSTVSSVETETVCAGGGTPTPTPTVTPTPSGSCPPQITESTSQDIVTGNSVACNNGFGTTENHYFRAFNMNAFTGGAEYDITSVDFGIESAVSGDGTGQPLTVNLYANHGSPFPGGDWQSNLIGTASTTIPDQANTVFNLPITATVATGTLELVYEVTTPDGTVVGNLFFIGSNPDPETGPSYLEAADCGVTVPTPTGDLGFPDMHIVMNVNGTCPGGTPTPTPTVTPTPIITPTPTVTPTPIITPTPTVTPTPVITPTPIITPTPTPRQSPTPRPRPTPHPRPTQP